MEPSLLSRSGTELADLIRRGRISSREAVDAHIRRIELVNPALNAMVVERFSQARREADAADRRLAQGSRDDLPPFWGVPCSIKECFALKGMPQTAGLVARRNVVASEDATAVMRLRQAGAIPLGVTNLSELCMWMESHNRVYGRTNNAYDRRAIAGGSSGGEGALVGAGGTPFGLGADIGGSIRMPAFFNGVFGHKPSGGLVPGSGQYPIAENEALRYLATGPLARRAEDLYPLVRILAGPDGIDSGCTTLALGDPAQVAIDDLTIVDVKDSGHREVDGELRAAQERALEALSRRGARIVTMRFPALTRSLEIWSAMMSAAGGTSFSELLGNGRPIRLAPALARFITGRSPHTLPALALALVEKLPGLMQGRAAKAIADGAYLKADLTARLGPRGVLLYPPYPRPAPPHTHPMWSPFDWVYTAIFNVLEFPVTQVPLGLSQKGLPLGVQVAAIWGQDAVTLAVARALEEDLGGWVPPPTLPPLV